MTIPSRLAGASVWLPLSTGSSSNGIGNGAWNGHHHYHQQPPQPWRQQQQQHRSARRGQRVHRLVLAVVFVSMSVWMLSQFHVYNRLARKNQQLSDPPARDDLLLPAATETTAATVAAENDKDARNQEKGTRTVGVAVTVTGCTDVFVDGAAVLQYSIMRQQQHNRNKKLRSTSSSRYQYHFYVIYHPSARECAEPLKDLNFTLVERESPVLPEDIQGNDLRATIAKSGCCGEKELLKFEAFTMTQHDAMILLDIDTMVVNPLDDALDLLLDRKVPHNPASHIMYPERALPDDIWILHTGDYEMVWPDVFPKPAQGGFAILKPNVTIYEEIMDIVREGKWSKRLGWGTDEAHTGGFYGVETFQGLIPYYFHVLKTKPSRVVELNWCRYNHMNIRPKENVTDPETNVTKETCWNNRNHCEDCRDRKLEDLSSVHFTICQKPWWCEPHDVNPKQDDKKRLCHQVHQMWFQWRSELEASWGRTGRGSSTDEQLVSQFRGYCSGPGYFAYEPIKLPYGRLAANVSRASSEEKAVA